MVLATFNQFVNWLDCPVRVSGRKTYHGTCVCHQPVEWRRETGDFPGQFRDMTFGEGEVAFDEVFGTLSKLGYRGTFVLEMWTEKADEPLEEIKKALAWIRERMAPFK